MRAGIIEIPSTAWEAAVLPLNDARLVRVEGVEPTRTGWKPAMQPLHLTRVAEDRAVEAHALSGTHPFPRESGEPFRFAFQVSVGRAGVEPAHDRRYKLRALTVELTSHGAYDWSRTSKL